MACCSHYVFFENINNFSENYSYGEFLNKAHSYIAKCSQFLERKHSFFFFKFKIVGI